jgi:hypothetical protein
MSENLPPDHLRKINEAINDFTKRHGIKDRKPGTPEWEAAVSGAVEKYQLAQYRKEFADRLEAELSKKPIVCIRDGHHEKCKEGPWFGAKCFLCNKLGAKLGLPDAQVPATR